MKNTKEREAEQSINIIHAYNSPQNIFEGIPAKYRSFFEFDVDLIKERYKDSEDDASSVILHRAYFETH